MTIRRAGDEHELDDDPARIDVDAVHDYLSLHAYWSLGRERSITSELIAGATRVVGLYADAGAQVGFARAVSDRHTFAYLADVYVLDAHRGRGLGTALVHELIEGSTFAHVRWMLGTRDAHEIYRGLGFGAPSDRIMERSRQDPIAIDLPKTMRDG